MCLEAHKDSTINFINKQKKRNKTTVTVWKILNKTVYGICSPYMGASVKLGDSFSAVYALNTHIITSYDKPFAPITYGVVHVYLTRKSARAAKKKMKREWMEAMKDIFIVKCEANMEDFIGCDIVFQEAAFTKILVGHNEKG